MILREYEKARKRGLRAVKAAVAEGRYPYLCTLDENLAFEETAGEIHLGVMEIPLEQVAGTKTKGRSESFACDFMPVLSENSEFAAKWESLYDSQMEEGIREPVKAYEYMNRFYVVEGNKRVSVMKYLGAARIPADVTRIMPKRTGEKSVESYMDFVRFNEVTGLFALVFTEGASYERLAELFGETLNQKWNEEHVRDLRSVFTRFGELFDEEKMFRLKLTKADAFLLYLEMYGVEDVLNESTAELRVKIQRARTEFLLSLQEEKAVLVEEPSGKELLEGRTEPAGFFGFRPFERFAEKRRLRIAFLNAKSPETSRWTYGHSLGWAAVRESFRDQTELFIYNNCDDDKSTLSAIEEAKAAGCEMIFTTAGQMYPLILREALNHPEIRFLNCSVNAPYQSVRTYYPRMYEAKFTLGAVAAALSEDAYIGYVADYPVYGVIAGINAFAIGAQLINPYAKIHLKWSSLGEDWAKAFSGEDVNLICAPDLHSPNQADELYGLVRYNRGKDVFEDLAMPVTDWGKYYKLLIRSVLTGSYEDKALTASGQAINYFWGMSAEVVDVFGANRLPYPTKRLLNILKNEIRRGDIEPFYGELHGPNGILKQKEGETLSLSDITRMNWLNENIVGEIPPIEAFKPEAAEFLRAFGVNAS